MLNRIKSTVSKTGQTFKKSDLHIRVFIWLVNLCLACVLISFVIVIYPKLPDSWDVLSFSGAIIGGTITWFGVKKTLLEQRRDKFLADFNNKIVVLEEVERELSFIFNSNFLSSIHTSEEAEKHLDLSNEEEELIYLKYNTTYMNHFIAKLGKRMSDIQIALEWSIYDEIHTLYSGLEAFNSDKSNWTNYVRTNSVENIRHRAKGEYEIALSIMKRIAKYREQLINDYKIYKKK